MNATEPVQTIQDWFASRIPSDWFTGAPDVRVDGEEILVVGRLGPPEDGDEPDPVIATARIKAFREETRRQRMAVAAEAEATFGRKVSWGAAWGEVGHAFTTLSTPVMTRLRMDERSVLDTLVRSGVARSRSEALAWCVRLVGSHEGDWLAELRSALVHVDEARASGPLP